MEGRRERRALAAGSHVGATEVGDSEYPGALGDHRSIADLQRERVPAGCAMSRGLSMRADRRDAIACDARMRNQRVGGVREALADFDV
jgi:hypothetical protein